jgi:hypothetical protein
VMDAQFKAHTVNAARRRKRRVEWRSSDVFLRNTSRDRAFTVLSFSPYLSFGHCTFFFFIFGQGGSDPRN